MRQWSSEMLRERGKLQLRRGINYFTREKKVWRFNDVQRRKWGGGGRFFSLVCKSSFVLRLLCFDMLRERLLL